MRVKNVFTMIITVVIAVAMVDPVSAAPVQLKQEIAPVDCTVTKTNSGSGTTYNSDCPPEKPAIETIDENGGRPIIRGLFDHANAVSFRVYFAGRWYVLGVDSELTAAGNVWTLDLSDLDKPLPPGDYNIIIEMKTRDGTVLENTGMAIVKNSDGSAGSLSPTGDNDNMYMAVGLMMTLLAASLLVVARRRAAR